MKSQSEFMLHPHSGHACSILLLPRVEHHSTICIFRSVLLPAAFSFILFKPRVYGARQDAALVIECIRELLIERILRVGGHFLSGLGEAVVEMAVHQSTGIEPIRTIRGDALEFSCRLEHQDWDILVKLSLPLEFFFVLLLLLSVLIIKSLLHFLHSVGTSIVQIP